MPARTRILLALIVLVLLGASSSWASNWMASPAAKETISRWEFWVLFVVAAGLPLAGVAGWRRLKYPLISAEWFLTAGRNLQAAPITTSLILIWIGLPSMLIAPRLGYQFGLAAVYGYAVGVATPLLWSLPFVLRLKQETPLVHTLPEWVAWRFDTRIHKLVTFLYLLLLAVHALFAALPTVALLHDFTQLDPYLLVGLLVIGFTLYTVIGGLRGTILTGYVQCGLFIVVVLALTVFLCNRYGDIGIYEQVSMRLSASDAPFALRLGEGVLIGSFSLVLHLGLAFGYQPFWQRCIATGPRSTIQVLLVAAFASFAILLALGTVFGLGGQIVGVPPDKETWVMAHVVYQALGHRSFLFFLLAVVISLFAVGSADLLSGATLVVTDIYRRYWIRNATDERLLNHTWAWLFLLGATTFTLGAYLWAHRIPAEWLYMAANLLVVGLFPPLMLGMFWKRVSSSAAFWGYLLGTGAGVAVWAFMGVQRYGRLVPRMLGNVPALLLGYGVALGMSAFLCVVFSKLTPAYIRMPRPITSFLSRKDIREQGIPLRFSEASYARYIERLTKPLRTLMLYAILGIWVFWILLLPVLALFGHARISHGLFVMWLIGALVSFMLSGGYLLLNPIIDIFQEEEPLLLALNPKEEDEHVSESED